MDKWKRRDKKRSKKKYGQRMDKAMKRLAEYLERKRKKEK